MSEKWNSKTPWNNDNYILRCLSADFGPSKSSGKPMITMEHEVIAPQEVEIGGKMVTVAGTKIKTYNVTQSINEAGEVDMEKTESIRERLEKLYAAYGLDFTTFNAENPDVTGFVGKCVHAYVVANPTEKRKSPTAEQLKKGEKQGDILKNPITGKPMVEYWPKIDEIFGLATDVAGGQF